jgi:outer membrane lipoprotein-sorting protein
MRSIALFLLFGAVASAAPATTGNLNPEEIIQRFAAKESQFRKARESYTYRQNVKIEELDPDGNMTGKYEITSDIIFGPNRQRIEKVVYAPMSTLHNLLLTPEDEQDLRSVQPFVLTSEDVSKYDVQYQGKEQVDEISCYVFDVKPKQMVKGQRYFQGKIWVDDRDLQIVKTYGKGVGILKKRGRYAALPHRSAAHSHDREIPELQEVRRRDDCHLRRRSGYAAKGADDAKVVP